MLSYILIVLCLSLSGVVALQMMYAIYIDKLDRDRKDQIRKVERRCKELNARIREQDAEISSLNETLESLGHRKDESWAEIID